MADVVAHRLKRARQAAGYRTALQFAQTHGIPQPTYALHESGKRGLTREVALNYAKLLGVSLDWLLTGDGPGPRGKVPLTGYVGAGDRVFPFDDEGAHEPIEVPEDLVDGFAVRVRGHSMEPVYRAGEVLVARAAEGVPPEAVGHDCIVQVHEGPRLVKRVKRGRKRGHFRLYSYATGDESDDVILVWAAPIRWVRRG